ncbi:MAG: ATP-dependent DNA helicase RecG [Vampirovibrionales bacterium]|nr:ATP-dependent DNA helicase RecG [Vampirovibrionales bacterium]
MLDEVTLRLKDLQQAIAIERKQAYTNVQGRRSTFAKFVSKTLNQLAKSRWVDPAPANGLEQQFIRYEGKDLNYRLHAVEALENWLIDLAQPAAAKPQALPDLNSDLDNDSMDVVRQPIALDQVPAPLSDGLNTIPVTDVKGIGPTLAKRLASVGINTVADLLHYYPRRYVDYATQKPIAELTDDEDVTIVGTLGLPSLFQAKNKVLWIMTVALMDGKGGRLQAQWFFRGVPRQQLEAGKARLVKGALVMMSGKVKWDSKRKLWSMDRPEVVLLDDDTDGIPSVSGSNLNAGRIVPVYPLTEGLHLRGLRRVMYQALQQYGHRLVDPYPPTLPLPKPLIPLPAAVRQIHFPESLAGCESARERLVFDELFYLQARLAMMRARYKQTAPGLVLERQPDGVVAQLLERLPFQLTNAQQRVLADIEKDLASGEPMYRLLQGDVGSGKTVVALLTLLLAVEGGYQGALMAPTEILAEQHYQRFVAWLTPLGLKVGLCLGKHTTKQRQEVLTGLANGQIHLAVGTHALIQDGVVFNNLGVVIIDEQHRFGVRQRMLLKDKGQHPHLLSMTATPIPRTLTMTLHGDLDVSLLDERPPGRQPIVTQVLRGSQRRQVVECITTEVVSGRQAYIVYPLIEDSETLAAKAATSEAERLQTEVFPQWRVGLLHGKLRSDEKEAVMGAFARGETHILVSTTVVEVGVDVANATVMVIENADRFGLSQLHQLRGRVGRGTHASYCLLVSNNASDETAQRLGVMAETDNGFVIAERDLQLRGPGEYLGTRQSGLPEFALADLVKDQETLIQARQLAETVINDGEWLLNYPALCDAIMANTDSVFGVLGSG